MSRLVDLVFTGSESVRVRYNGARQRAAAVAAGYSAVEHITFAAYATVWVGVLETVLSLLAGSGNGSDGVLSITILGLAETVGGLLVLYRWRFMSQTTARARSARVEVGASLAIALLMQLLGANLFVTALLDLVWATPHTRLAAGLWVAVFGATTSLVLYKYKMFYGAQLQSIVVITDAHCSRCTGYVSACVALALLIQGVVWWADSALGLLLACYIIFDGVSNMQAARAEWQTLKDAPGAAPTNGTGGARSEPLLSAPERVEFAQEQDHMGSQSIVF